MSKDLFPQQQFFLLGEEICSRHPSGLGRHISRKNNFWQASYSFAFGDLWLNHCVPSSILESPRELKSGANNVYHDLTLMVFSFLTFRLLQEYRRKVCILEKSFLLRKMFRWWCRWGILVVFSLESYTDSRVLRGLSLRWGVWGGRPMSQVKNYVHVSTLWER